MAVAGAVMLGLVGGLVIFDVLNRPPTPAPAPEMPRMAADTTPSVVPAASAEAAAALRPANEAPAAVAEVPERSEASLATRPSEKPLTVPALPTPTALRPSAPASDAAKAEPPAERGSTKPSGPVAEGTRRAPAAGRPDTAAPPAAAHHFLLQVGVFNNPLNAEELAARLREAGIPVHIETRVQAGPFATRAEVDAARAKLKSMGIDDGILVRR